NWGRYFDQLSAGQMNIARVQISWRSAEPSAPVGGVHIYNWNAGGPGSRDSIDYIMTLLAQRGIRAAPLFAAVPAWVSANGYRMSSAAYPNFASFVAAFAGRYGPGGAFWAEHPELSSLPTLEYEIWTEANSTNFWTGQPNANEYAFALQQISTALHRAQPGATLLASIGWQNFAAYISDLAAAGGLSAVDGIGFHPYAPHAPAIIGLVTALRTKLNALGRQDMPIEVTESGQPVVTSGAGAASAGDGLVTDAARAATQSFTADALARSNCGVGQFLVYALTGDGSNGEGLMGVFRHADATPYVTGAALQRSSLRWVAQYNQGNPAANSLSLCGGTTPTSSMVAMGLTLKKTGDTCALGTAGYDGNPIEGATLQVSAPNRGSYGQPTNAYGQNTVCLANGTGAASYFEVYATIPNAGRSAIYRCAVPLSATTPCVVQSNAPAPPGSPVPLDATSALPADNPAFTSSTAGSSNGVGVTTGSGGACGTWRILTAATTPKRDKRGVKSTTTLSATLQCGSLARGTKVRFALELQKKGKKKTTPLQTVYLQNLKKVKVKVHGQFGKGDLLVLLHAVNAKTQGDGVSRIQTTRHLNTPKALSSRSRGRGTSQFDLRGRGRRRRRLRGGRRLRGRVEPDDREPRARVDGRALRLDRRGGRRAGRVDEGVADAQPPLDHPAVGGIREDRPADAGEVQLGAGADVLVRERGVGRVAQEPSREEAPAAVRGDGLARTQVGRQRIEAA
ncbi:MAG: hypothetical protein AAGC46_17915, partial [Solirubrobacteraceae bacterium]